MSGQEKQAAFSAVMYGAGNIGRGFIGAKMAQGGGRVTFVDVNPQLVGQLREQGQYSLRVIGDEGHKDEVITGVTAVDGRDGEAVIRAIADCDVMATAVGARVLPHIAPQIARGILRRFERDAPPMNILVCENLMGAGQTLAGLLKQGMDARQAARLDSEVGLVEASIGRMVPIQTEALRENDPLRVCVEAYAFLPVDRAAIRGTLPPLPGLVPYAPFDFYIKRKLFLHNMSHAACSYLGLYAGDELLSASIHRPVVELMVRAAMQESALALARAYREDISALAAHGDDLVRRYKNRALGDSNARVGADIPRKLGAKDRLIGAALLCLDQGINPVFIALAAAAALHRHLAEQNLPAGAEAAGTALSDLSDLPAGHELHSLILSLYAPFAAGEGLDGLYAAARAVQADARGPVI